MYAVKDTQLLQRISWRWVPADAYEDTDTIALNVGGYFLDVRITLEDQSVWARAGQRIKLKEDPPTVCWTRIIDSTGSSQTDEGSFKWLENGDGLEYGNYFNGTAKVPYEEVWRDVTPSPLGPTGAWIIQSADGQAFLGRVGDVFVGMRQYETSFGVRKSVLGSHNVDGSEEWKTQFENGSMEGIPDVNDVEKQLQALLQETADLALGSSVTVGGEAYIIRGVSK